MIYTLQRILSFDLTLKAHSVAALLTRLPSIATTTWRFVDEATSSLSELPREERSIDDCAPTDRVVAIR